MPSEQATEDEFRTKTPTAQHTLTQLEALVKTVSQGDCLVICGDFNCQLKRNIPGLTGKWAMTKQHEKQGHDQELLDFMSTYELFVADTNFKPRARLWANSKRKRTTYLPKHKERRPTKLNYFLTSKRWMGMVTSAKIKWGSSLHRFGTKFDHTLLDLEWAWRVRVRKSPPKHDFQLMTDEH